MLNVSSLLGVRRSGSDALRYGAQRDGERTPDSALARRPVVVWNSTRACNLTCTHCYASAKSGPAPDELSRDEAFAFLDDLATYGVPAVLLSGGEPLTRPDLLELIGHGIDRGLRFTLSTNGTLIDKPTAVAIAGAGVTYVGVSIDGSEATHDRVRCRAGAWEQSVRGLRNLASAGAKRGVRYTLTPDSRPDLHDVLGLVEREHVERFCMYHLAPSGRGKYLHDVTPDERRTALRDVFEFALTHPEVEVLTVDNPSDGVALLQWLADHDPDRAEACRAALVWNRGARGGPGIGLAAVDERGDVHPDQFSRHRTVGNVRHRPFSEIWSHPEDPYLQALRAGSWSLSGECQACEGRELCNGGLRSRAEQSTGDIWGFDPSCSLRAS